MHWIGQFYKKYGKNYLNLETIFVLNWRRMTKTELKPMVRSFHLFRKDR